MLLALAMVAATAAASSSQPEMALRCSVVESAPLLVRNAPTFGGTLGGGPAAVAVSKPLPQVMVEGWTVDRMPIDQALAQLGKDGGFTVRADDGLQPVSWKGEAAPLATVVARLAQSAGGVASFDGAILHISKPAPAAPWRYRRPEGRDATLALLDALRGYGATKVSLEPDAITFEASPAVVARVRKGLSASNGVVAFDVWSYRLTPRSQIDWKTLGEVSPVLESHVAPSGSQFVLGYVSTDDVARFLGRLGDVAPLGSQTVAGPQGWSVEVPLAQCSGGAIGAGGATLKPVWTGTTMNVTVSGTTVGSGSIAAIAPGSSAVLVGPQSAGSMVVAVIRPRVLIAR